MSDDTFFLQYIGDERDCAVFERAGRHGYTCMLDQAGIFTRAEAEAAVRGIDERRMLPVSEVLPLIRKHVDVSDLAKLYRRFQDSEAGS